MQELISIEKVLNSRCSCNFDGNSKDNHWRMFIKDEYPSRMPVPKFVCGVTYASGFASSMDGDVPWDTRSIVWKARPNTITSEKGI